MGKVFFLSGEIVVNGSQDASAFDDNHDISGALLEKKACF